MAIKIFNAKISYDILLLLQKLLSLIRFAEINFFYFSLSLREIVAKSKSYAKVLPGEIFHFLEERDEIEKNNRIMIRK